MSDQFLNKKDYYYDLPESLIGQDPLEDRSSSRLLVLNRENGKYEDDHFYNIKNYLKAGDVLVINDTKVIPARLIGKKEETGGVVEILLLKRRQGDIWECLAGPGKKARVGGRIEFGDGSLKCEVIDVLEDGNRLIHFEYDGIFEEVLDALGEMPLPPYITHKLQDKTRYQTVYAKNEGSAAAPTAGLHFTKELMEELKEKGITIVPVTLHVGLGTFRPVKEDNILEHKMHTEWCQISKESADIINKAKEEGRRVIAVGTTSCRTLESMADDINDSNENIDSQGDKSLDYHVLTGCKETDIFIYPGYKFRIIDGLITNFHLPESTLVMLVSAFSSREFILNAYKHAVDENYRFFSFGDAMFII